MKSNLLEKIPSNYIKNYAGQLVDYLEIQEKLPAEKKKLSGEERFVWGSIHSLYSHQWKAWEAMKAGKNIFVLTSPGGGKTSLLLAVTLHKILNENKNIIFITSAQQYSNFTRDVLKAHLRIWEIEWATKIVLWKEIEDPSRIFPQVVLMTVEELHEALIEHRDWEAFWINLGAILVDDVQNFQNIQLTHLYWLFKRLRRITAFYKARSPQFILTSVPIRNSNEVAELLTGEGEWEIVRDNNEFRTGKKVFFWVPPLGEMRERPTLESENWLFTVRREDYLEEIKRLSSTEPEKPKVLLVKDGFFGKTDLSTYRDIWGLENFYIGTDLNEIFLQILDDPYRKIQSIREIERWIFLGFEGSLAFFGEYTRYIGKLGGENLIFVLFPQVPRYQYYLNRKEELLHPESITRYNERLPYLPIEIEREKVKRLHICSSLYEVPAEKERFKREWNVDDNDLSNLRIETYREWKFSDRSAENIEMIRVEDPDLDINHLFSGLEEEQWEIQTESGETLGYTDNFGAYFRFYPNGLGEHNRRRYRVFRWDVTNKRIIVREEDTFAITVPIFLNPKIQDIKIGPVGSLKLSTNIKFYSFIGKLRGQLKGYKFYKFQDPEIPEDKLTYETNYSFETEVSGLAIEFPDPPHIHSLGHLLYSSLRTWILEREPVFFYDSGNTVYLYSRANSKKSWELLATEDTIRELLWRSYSLLADVPSSSPSTGDLITFECFSDSCELELEEEGLGAPIKERILEYLVDLLKPAEGRNIIRWKFKGLDPSLDNERLQSIRNHVLSILENRLGIKLMEPYPCFFMEPEEAKAMPNVGGYAATELKVVKVRPGLKEEEVYEVVAHEYTHNWQFEGNLNKSWIFYDKENLANPKNVYYKAKLFVEGEAVLGGLEILSHFGLRKFLIRVKDNYPFSYYTGYITMRDILNWKQNFKGTFEFLKNETFEGSKPIIENSGLFRTIPIIENFKADYKGKGGLLCLHPLRRDNDFIAVTHALRCLEGDRDIFGETPEEERFPDMDLETFLSGNWLNIDDDEKREKCIEKIKKEFEEKILKPAGFSENICLRCEGRKYESLKDVSEIMLGSKKPALQIISALKHAGCLKNLKIDVNIIIGEKI